MAFLTGSSIDQNLFRWISGATGAVLALWFIYEKWIWKWPLFDKISSYYGTPVVYGTWKGTLKYEKDQEGKSGSVDVYVAISQTLTSLSVRSFFRHPSESYSITAKIKDSESKGRQLVYSYRSEAPHGSRDNNRPHDGVCILNIIGSPVKKLDGSYFTDRGGAGIITLDKHCNKLAESFDDSENLNYL